MDAVKQCEDQLQEAACFGDEEAVNLLLDRGGNVNAQHKINGWTALHWAVKRSHINVISLLLKRGANPEIQTKKGETPASLTDNEEILKLFPGHDRQVKAEPATLPITPSYINSPSFGHKVKLNFPRPSENRDNPFNRPTVNGTTAPVSPEDELVLKIRVANIQDPDFIEVELPRSDITFSRMLLVCCEELNVDLKHVIKIRKLPDTILRKDKDVRRLKDFQEVEVVVNDVRSKHSTSASQHAMASDGIQPYLNSTINTAFQVFAG